ncbi:DUF2922 domain-containing protein [Periweissella cryptocerci]|uniref:DUF2922 domain-containing protein n=1 Tax=Periweissella cryptocerci TaxID=2506420 RepID=A0A4P6YR00_9LACO|nr:DUF2922 domain-containing protein [Periweissella cryptocerci]QBO35012.1 DUF2922 domain-containing protein [Periweissella cryptocerci]
MTEAKKLVLTFKGSHGKSTSLTLAKFKEPVDPAKVKAAMTTIAQSKIFVTKEGHFKYMTPVSARIVATQTDAVDGVATEVSL